MSRVTVLAVVCTLAACTPLRPLDPIDEADAGHDAGPIVRDAGADAPSVDSGIDAGCDPSAVELCNGLDDDCDPATDDGSGDPRIGMPCDGPDADACTEGTYGGCAGGALACSDATTDTLETCDLLGADEDCDGLVDEAGAVGARMFYADVDHDGYGDDASIVLACTRPGDVATRGGDCDDADPDVRPGHAEDCDARDDDCDGMIDDGDPCGVASCTTGSYGGHTYQFCRSGRAWDTATSVCTGFGYHLATVETADENTWLIMQSISRGLTFATGGVWIGLRYDAATADWRWTDGTSATFTDWGSTEPDQMACARIRPAAGDWADQDCGTSVAFVCETP